MAGENLEKSCDELFHEVRIWTKVIRENTGIELKWGEIAKLKHYISCFKEHQKRNNSETNSEFALVVGQEESCYAFLQDVFGLDIMELDKVPLPVYNRSGKLIRYDWGKTYGAGFFGTPEFKEYCKRNVKA